MLATGFDRYSGLLRTPIVLVALSVLTGCVKYRPKPLEPPRLEQEYRARSLSEPGLRSFVEANASAKPSQWPPAKLNLEALTLVALYYSPELEIARAQVARADARIVTARGRFRLYVIPRLDDSLCSCLPHAAGSAPLRLASGYVA